ncbi:helix-turn-helix domain-containing protein [Nocardia sp. CA-128927]|uniref:helix-turn-helix domain-containing protein n=1 Tax=Nocardia sp. CA-128927 TaxID=3239975 RepID=UPI003D99FB00
MTGRALSETCDPPVLWIRAGHAGYLGPTPDLDAHSTSIACLAVGVDAPFVFHAAECGEVVTRSAFAPARWVHRLFATEGRTLYLFIDSAQGARRPSVMRKMVGPYGFTHRTEAELIAACADQPLDLDHISNLAGIPIIEPIDPRIVQAARMLRTDPGHGAGARDMAARFELSPSHFQHLFTQHTGTSFRRYRQWARMLYVAKGYTAGHDLTRCAVDAGFATLSHFSETFHRMFGLSATSLLATGLRLDVLDGRAGVAGHPFDGTPYAAGTVLRDCRGGRHPAMSFGTHHRLT